MKARRLAKKAIAAGLAEKSMGEWVLLEY